MYKVWLFIISSTLIQYNLPAQSDWLLETYYYSGKPLSGIVSMLHVETKKGWYTEIRYNYEDVKTISLFTGKTFRGGTDIQYSVTPLLGYSLGTFNGISLGVNAEAAWKDFFVSTQSQYSRSVKDKSENFFFTWSEAGYNICPNFYAGFAIQYTKLTDQSDVDPGFLAGLNYKNISFPCYIFSPFERDRYFVLGLNYEFCLKKKKSIAL
jgi:hypothetical protein